MAEQLDHLGVDYIEGGWPGANPKDAEFFERAPAELRLERSQLVAFGSTRRAGVKADDDEVLRNLVKAGTPVACIVAKSWDYHVTEALRTTLDEAVAMVSDSVEFLRNAGLEVFLDAEHFFDGYRNNPEFALRVLRAAHEAGATRLVLCDTNGGTLPARGGSRSCYVAVGPLPRRRSPRALRPLGRGRLRGRGGTRAPRGGRPAHVRLRRPRVVAQG